MHRPGCQDTFFSDAPSFGQGQRFTLAMWAFFDDSGKLADSEFICLCGCIADAGNWDKFQPAWDILLNKYKLPYMRMASLISREKPFDKIHWTAEEEIEILGKFAQIIRDATWAYFSVAVDAKHYRAMSEDERELFGQKDALDFVFQRLLGLIIEFKQERPWELPVMLGFDCAEDFAMLCLKSFIKLRMRRPQLRKAAQSITFADSKEISPLQAADMFAYGTNRLLRHIPPSYLSVLTAGSATNPGPTIYSEDYKSEHLDELIGKIKRGEIDPL